MRYVRRISNRNRRPLPAPLPPHPSLPRSRLPRAEAAETAAADVTGANNGDDIDL